MRTKRILTLHYSQSGDVAKVLDTFVSALQASGLDAEVVRQRIEPTREYPYPWKSLVRLFSVFPECFMGPVDAVQPLPLAAEDRFDLAIIAYQVWHLAPSLPVQAFLRSPQAAVLHDTPVITLCVSRNMWQSASETLKRLLQRVGAKHIDNVVVTHQGPPFSTFVSVPRALLYGKRDRLWGVFPPADLSETDLARVRQLGAAAADRLAALDQRPERSLLTGLPAVTVRRRYILPELWGWHAYRVGARFVHAAGRLGPWGRQAALYLFIAWLLTSILIGIPAVILASLVLSPFIHGKMARYAVRLTEPSGGIISR